MGTRTTIHREHRVTIRLSDEEMDQLDYMMQRSGYLSMSKYIRTKCLGGRISMSPESLAESNSVRSQVNVLSAEISKIGANYNLVIKDFKNLLGQTKKDGSPVINTSTATYYMQQLYTLTLEVKTLVKEFIELVKKELKESTK